MYVSGSVDENGHVIQICPWSPGDDVGSPGLGSYGVVNQPHGCWVVILESSASIVQVLNR